MAEQHTFTTAGKLQGKFSKKCGYRINAYNTISTCGKKTIYTKPVSIKAELLARGTKPSPNNVQAGSLEHAARYFFSYKSNFNKDSAPYKNQAHHIIPQQVFLNLFDEEEKEILKMIKYDIDNGHNLIYLPEEDENCNFHLLPRHSGAHPDYSEAVEETAKDLSQQLQEYIDDEPCEKKDEIPQDVADQLYDIQDKLWDFLINAGPVPIYTLTPDIQLN